ncbi:unnamed protein product [Linum trigynum]|uniref:Uncharacterized protein n=1 Tax=Linum trigynum TaxID=586398 RepID=A0AAV2D119_9ROSI
MSFTIAQNFKQDRPLKKASFDHVIKWMLLLDVSLVGIRQHTVAARVLNWDLGIGLQIGGVAMGGVLNV